MALRSLCLCLAFTSITLGGLRSQEKHPGGKPAALPESLIDSLESHVGVTYSEVDQRTLKLDLYRPRSDERLPAVICIHGGGWWRGSRDSQRLVAQALAGRGFVAATISYRLSGEAPFPAQINDVKAAVRFLLQEADLFRIDPSKIGATGLSAGGHLAALLATSGGNQTLIGKQGDSDTINIQAAVPLGAQTDLRRHHPFIERSDPAGTSEKPNIWVQFLAGKPSQTPDLWSDASPQTHLDTADPPMLFITGELDKESTHAIGFREQMSELGIPERLVVIPKAPHAFLGRQIWFDAALEEMAEFFEETLK